MLSGACIHSQRCWGMVVPDATSSHPVHASVLTLHAGMPGYAAGGLTPRAHAP